MGRPDMALFKFTKNILNNEPIDVYNNGNMMRDFTYVDDIVEAISRLVERPAQPNKDWSGENPSQILVMHHTKFIISETMLL